MKDDNRTKKQLINELTELRSQHAALNQSTTGSISSELADEDARRYAESIVETVREPLLVLDADLKILSANRNFYKTFKVTPGETIGSFIYNLGNKQWDIPKLRELLEEVLPEKEAFDDFEVAHTFQDIGQKIMLLNARQIYRKNISAKMILLAIEDITERKRLESLLEESEERYRRLFETASDGIVLLEKREGKITHANPATEKMLGYTKKDSIGHSLQNIGILLDTGDFPMTLQNLNKIGISNYDDVPIKTKSGQHIDADIYLVDRARLVQCNIRDITERKRTEKLLRASEERLNRAEKMESLGTLAGGVAHDLNNVLGGVIGYSELLRDELPENSPLRRFADSIVQSGVRGAAIIQDLLTLARRSVNIAEVVDLNKSISNYLQTPEFEQLKSHHPAVKIRIDLEDKLLNIKGSPTHLGKTIMNLVSNAAEAISGQGEVTIKTENCYLDRPIHGYDEMQEGDYVVLKVSDTGTGISGNDIKKIFEPFYTKKVMGRSGTGLGLAVVWGTVKDHHGYIDILSEEGKGSTFILYFPVTRDEPAKVEKVITPTAYMGRNESILVVDDVKEQRELAMNMLGKLGYEVKTVASGEEAIEYLQNKKADLIVLDMIMDPGIDGTETYRRILEINPVQKAVIVSGFSETDRVRKAQEMGAGTFVQKPYILENIGLAVRKELVP